MTDFRLLQLTLLDSSLQPLADKISVAEVAPSFKKQFSDEVLRTEYEVKTNGYSLRHGDIIIAAITDTLDVHPLIEAALFAQKACERGMRPKPWVKTGVHIKNPTFTDYLQYLGLDTFLATLGFPLFAPANTSIHLEPALEETLTTNQIPVAAALAGNGPFEKTVWKFTTTHYLMSPLLVIAYALVGSLKVNLIQDSLGYDIYGNKVYLKDLWPTPEEIQENMEKCKIAGLFQEKNAHD